MTEQDMTHVEIEKTGPGFRSHLLMPVMEGRPLESKDLSNFLGGRLSDGDKNSERAPALRLS
jgi:hypothetical protein